MKFDSLPEQMMELHGCGGDNRTDDKDRQAFFFWLLIVTSLVKMCVHVGREVESCVHLCVFTSLVCP